MGAPQAKLKNISLAGHDFQTSLFAESEIGGVVFCSPGLGLPLKIYCVPTFLVFNKKVFHRTINLTANGIVSNKSCTKVLTWIFLVTRSSIYSGNIQEN